MTEAAVRLEKKKTDREAVAAMLELCRELFAEALLALYGQASDPLIHALNQLLKCAAIVLGAVAAIGLGGERGFFTGMTVAMLYMALGYGMAVSLGGNAFAVPGMLGEILIGAALGGVAGAVLSNLPERRRRAKAA